MANLKGKVAIVTGAGSGIGKGIAEVFAAEGGATVVLADRDVERGSAVAAELASKEGTCSFIECDVSDESQVAHLVATTVEQHGSVHVLVNNAGVNFVKPFDELTTADWDRVLNIDLRGVFLCTRACVEHFLKKKSGAVVNIASVHTMAAVPGAAPYDAAKWGVVGMTKSLACEYASRNIRFNCISPGLIDTQIWSDMLAAAEDADACRDHWWANIPAARVGTPQEMGRIAAFLASDKASYINGANLFADGGMTSQLISKESYRSDPID